MQSPPNPTPPPATDRRSRAFSTRKRRAAWVLTAFLTIAIVLAGIQGWRVVTAIMHMEQAAVVPLPPSTTDVADKEPAIAAAPSTAGLLGDSQPDFGAGTQLEGDGSTADNVGGTVNETQISVDRPPEANADVEKVETLSQMEIAQALVEAGMADGDPGQSSVWGGKDSLIIMVLGVDRREDGGDQNADVIIVARLDLLNHTLTGVSIPRDLLVEIPGIGEDKINGSYNYGVLAAPDDPAAGVAKVRDTLESMLDVHIDGYVLVDFSGFESIVDALGGVEVDVPYAIVDDEYPTEDYGTQVVRFEPGLQRMDGEEALKYVRTRHADSDDARRERQIDVIVSILDQGRSLSSIRRADELILSAADAIQTSFNLEEQLTLARLARTMSPEDVSIVNLEEPLLTSDWTDDGMWVYTADLAELRQFVHEAIYPDN